MIEIDEILNNSRLDITTRSIELRKQILDLVSEYTKISHNTQKFIPGETLVPVSGRVYDDTELRMLVASSLDFWLTSGRF
jgi:CDP-6-deoxy-D-xylo-4-hexulose-3-dehydrase